ncbi:TetR/AcrR family transcriptional regulator [Streptomyces sp. UNOC14_S4]|uniref:TetR/AcrR family transcriptional regulator n=1 Tax=Streptomyces sp. UNOC14_S4 TaxID=2872340 RepID=UPI001E4C1213|nr:TetR/AcrR family transcriptional regulator [Streptomyces sp. UNOC14_S4]MCC3769876.1 TetR/AcrR family transcriptional regulator [Streptomyces sp. UNOC14_S4]
MVRMSAEERRESVIRAAVTEFARGGYHGTSTEAIARRVGVSQPYLFRLFPGKQAIFLAAAERCVSQTRQVFENAVADLPADATVEERSHAVAAAYRRLLTEDPEQLLMQMQIYAAVASAEAGGEPEFGEVVRGHWAQLWDTVHLGLGGDAHETKKFMAYGMLVNTLVALGFPGDHRVWGTFWDEARPA